LLHKRREITLKWRLIKGIEKNVKIIMKRQYIIRM
jgi:hypothetical protein